MKTSIALLRVLVAAAVVAPASAFAAPSYLQRDGMGGYRVTYDYADHPKTGWYIGGNAGLSLLSWENKMNATSDVKDFKAESETESFSMKPVFQGGVQIGRTINYFWRAEFEAGWQGKFSDKESDGNSEFTLTIPYMMLNGYYDFNSGFYLGLGAGVALPTTTLDTAELNDTDRTKVSVAGMGALYIGYSHRLDTHIMLDLRYRLSGVTGFKHELSGEFENGTLNFETKSGFIFDNSITLGLRYEF